MLSIHVQLGSYRSHFLQTEMLEHGNELMENQDYAAAIKVFERFIRHFPEHAEAHLLARVVFSGARLVGRLGARKGSDH